MTKEGEDPAPLDVEGAIRRLLDNRALYLTILREFRQHHHGDSGLLQARLAAGDRQGCVTLSHSLRGAAKFIGAKRLELAAQHLERGLRSDSGDDLQPLLIELRSALEAVLDAVERELPGPR